MAEEITGQGTEAGGGTGPGVGEGRTEASVSGQQQTPALTQQIPGTPEAGAPEAGAQQSQGSEAPQGVEHVTASYISEPIAKTAGLSGRIAALADRRGKLGEKPQAYQSPSSGSLLGDPNKGFDASSGSGNYTDAGEVHPLLKGLKWDREENKVYNPIDGEWQSPGTALNQATTADMRQRMDAQDAEKQLAEYERMEREVSEEESSIFKDMDAAINEHIGDVVAKALPIIKGTKLDGPRMSQGIRAMAGAVLEESGVPLNTLDDVYANREKIASAINQVILDFHEGISQMLTNARSHNDATRGSAPVTGREEPALPGQVSTAQMTTSQKQQSSRDLAARVEAQYREEQLRR